MVSLICDRWEKIQSNQIVQCDCCFNVRNGNHYEYVCDGVCEYILCGECYKYKDSQFCQKCKHEIDYTRMDPSRGRTPPPERDDKVVTNTPVTTEFNKADPIGYIVIIFFFAVIITAQFIDFENN